MSSITPIVLIGPMMAGKSTLARLLAKRLNRPHDPLDDRRWAYYEELGYDNTKAQNLMAEGGMWALLDYWKPFEAHAVTRVLADYPQSIIDFGAGHSVYDDSKQLARVRQALAPCRHVILVLPSAETQRSIAVLNQRLTDMFDSDGKPLDEDVLAVNAYFVRHAANAQLATMTLYTEAKTPERCCNEIVAALSH